MSSIFHIPVLHKHKHHHHHPWQKTINPNLGHLIKTAHNSVNNPQYPPDKERKPNPDRVKFTIIGNRVTREFIYCCNLVKGLHKYRCQDFAPPEIRPCTSVEWPDILHSLQVEHGGLSFCLMSQVAVLFNEKFLGGDRELIDLIETKFIYYLSPKYPKEALKNFSSFIKASGRPCAYLHISIDERHIGTMLFQLYSDMVPKTCENFLRLCQSSKGGYSGTPVHRIVKDGWIQCGGYGLRKSNLCCENFYVPFDRRGVLAMANDGRHIDCSTQFFILLQPAQWMTYKYVAFGQLIDGLSVLEELESSPTWYESPTQIINIHHAGLLNMECQDIMINRGAVAYISDHTEDLVAIGNTFMEMIMERVFLEIQFRRLQRMDHGPGEGATEEDHLKHLRTTQRFLRNKDEMQKTLDKTIMDSARASTAPSMYDDKPEPEPDPDSYRYEEYSYKQVSPSISIEPMDHKPYYLALTDVPYPDECDSTFDLKKFLKGDYCLEADLTVNASKGQHLAPKEKKSSSLSVFNFFGEDQAQEETEKDLDSDEEKEIKQYIKDNVDRLSFAGMIVRGIAKAQTGQFNLFDKKRKSDIIATDEELRRIRLKSVDMGSRQESRKVIIGDRWDKRFHEIKRRQTGFVGPEELAKIRVYQKQKSTLSDDEDEDEEDDEGEDGSRRVKLAVAEGGESKREQEKKEAKDHRRPTAFVRGTLDEEDVDDEDEDNDEPKVRIAADEEVSAEEDAAIRNRRPTGFVRGAQYDDEDEESDEADLKHSHTDAESSKVRIDPHDKDKKKDESDPAIRMRRPTGFVRASTNVDDDEEEDEELKVRIEAIEEEDDVDDEEAVAAAIRNRRPTGFVRPGTYTIDDDDDADDDDDDDDDPKVRIDAQEDDEDEYKTIVRRPTAFVRPGQYVPDDDDEDDDEGDVGDVAKVDDDADNDAAQRAADLAQLAQFKVRISVNTPEPGTELSRSRRPTAFVQTFEVPPVEDEEVEIKEKRPSMLARLLQDCKTFDDEPGPTLKNYKPLAEIKEQHQNILLTRSNHDYLLKMDDADERVEYHDSIQMKGEIEEALIFQHGTKLVRKISTDYVKTMGNMMMQSRRETSIRTVEYARTRPCLSVDEYQRRNKMFKEIPLQRNVYHLTRHPSNVSHISKMSHVSKMSHKNLTAGPKTSRVQHHQAGDAPTFSHTPTRHFYDET